MAWPPHLWGKQEHFGSKVSQDRQCRYSWHCYQRSCVAKNLQKFGIYSKPDGDTIGTCWVDGGTWFDCAAQTNISGIKLFLKILCFPGVAWIFGKSQEYTEKVGGINGDFWGGGGTLFDYVAQANAFGIKFFLESWVFLEVPGFLENSRNVQKK